MMVDTSSATPATDFKKGEHFVYLSARTGLLTWGEVIEEPSDSGFLTCRLFSSKTSDGVDGDVTVNAIRCRIAAHDFEAARIAGWPDSLEAFLSFAKKIRQDRLSH